MLLPLLDWTGLMTLLLLLLGLMTEEDDAAEDEAK